MYESCIANRSMLENFSVLTKKKNHFQLFSPLLHDSEMKKYPQTGEKNSESK